jgi:hypothetical protein
MFNLDEIDKKELRYDVALDIIDENDERKSFMLDVFRSECGSLICYK